MLLSYETRERYIRNALARDTFYCAHSPCSLYLISALHNFNLFPKNSQKPAHIVGELFSNDSASVSDITKPFYLLMCRCLVRERPGHFSVAPTSHKKIVGENTLCLNTNMSIFRTEGQDLLFFLKRVNWLQTSFSFFFPTI